MSVSLSDRSAGAKLSTPGDLATARLFFLLTTGLSLVALPQLVERGRFSGQAYATYSVQWLVLLGVIALVALANLALLILFWTRSGERIIAWLAMARQKARKQPLLLFAGFCLPWAGYVLLILYRYQKHFADFPPQVWVFFLACGIGALFFYLSEKKPALFSAFLFTAVLYGAGVKALGYLPEISSIPFSLSWSEGSRYYYASLPYARWLYGFDTPLSSLHPSRYLLQGIAFWAPRAGILFHRLWQVVLWLSLSLLAGLVLARRFRDAQPLFLLAAALWSALFLLQGPVYYHLLVCVILVLWGFDRERFWKTMGVVVLASLWAGISRVNWMPVPAMLAAALYLLERPVCAADRGGLWPGWRTARQYLAPPLAWGIAGGLAALASQAAYVLVSGHEDVSHFSTSFSSALLWYRLLPSPTYPMGVLPAMLLVGLPMMALIAGNWMKGREHWHGLRILGIGVMGAVLFAGGLVVSTKIGGGSNLHNMDAFIVLLLITGMVIGLGRFASETGGWPRVWRPWPLLLLVVLVPVVYNLNIGDPFVKRDHEQAAYDLNKLNVLIQQYAPDGEVLFITQRQLEVFGLVPGVRMVPDYELITLTEMAMANNRPYLNRFHADLRSHRFALIVTSRQNHAIKNPAVDSFAEENNAWVEHVVLPLYKYYKEAVYLDTQGIQLFIPKE